MQASDEQLTATARRALEHWDIDVDEFVIASRSENVVFKISHAGRPSHVLRLHRPGYNTLDELDAELLWTAALNASGVAVPAHSPTKEGDAYASVTLAGTGQILQAGMIEWVAGAPLASLIERADASQRLDYFSQLARVIARAHGQASSWRPPAGFTRRRWDADGLAGPAPLWGKFWLAPQLGAAERALLDETRRKIHTALTAYGKPSGEFSLIHADLHPYNVLVDGSQLHIIDFDDCGYGWHVYDIAVALFNYRRDADFDGIREAFFAAYRDVRPLRDEASTLLPLFFLIRCLVWLGWINARPELLDEKRVRKQAGALCEEARAFLDRD